MNLLRIVAVADALEFYAVIEKVYNGIAGIKPKEVIDLKAMHESTPLPCGEVMYIYLYVNSDNIYYRVVYACKNFEDVRNSVGFIEFMKKEKVARIDNVRIKKLTRLLMAGANKEKTIGVIHSREKGIYSYTLGGSRNIEDLLSILEGLNICTRTPSKQGDECFTPYELAMTPFLKEMMKATYGSRNVLLIDASMGNQLTSSRSQCVISGVTDGTDLKSVNPRPCRYGVIESSLFKEGRIMLTYDTSYIDAHDDSWRL